MSPAGSPRRRSGCCWRLRVGDVCAEQPAAAGVGHELDEASGVTRGERARHLVEPDRRRADLISSGAGRCLCQPDACHLWVREHDGGYGAVVVTQAVAVQGVFGGELGAISVCQ